MMKFYDSFDDDDEFLNEFALEINRDLKDLNLTDLRGIFTQRELGQLPIGSLIIKIAIITKLYEKGKIQYFTNRVNHV